MIHTHILIGVPLDEKEFLEALEGEPIPVEESPRKSKPTIARFQEISGRVLEPLSKVNSRLELL